MELRGPARAGANGRPRWWEAFEAVAVFQSQDDEGIGESTDKVDEKEKMSCCPALLSAGLLCPFKKSNNPSLCTKSKVYLGTLMDMCYLRKPLNKTGERGKGYHFPLKVSTQKARPI